MRSSLIFRSISLSLALSLAAAQPGAAIAQKGGGSSRSAPAVDNPAEFQRASQCTGLYQMMAGMIPPSAPQRAVIDMRLDAWLNYAAMATPRGRAAAQTAAEEQAQALNARLVKLRGDADALEALMAPLNTQCENAPPATVPAPAPRVVQPSESTLKVSEGRMECAGLHRYFEVDGGGTGPMFFGDSKQFIDNVTRQRPDLTPAEIEARVEAYRAKWDAAYETATDNYVEALKRGESAKPALPEGLIELAERCDNTAGFL